jgi:hypothetical protein
MVHLGINRNKNGTYPCYRIGAPVFSLDTIASLREAREGGRERLAPVQENPLYMLFANDGMRNQTISYCWCFFLHIFSIRSYGESGDFAILSGRYLFLLN